MPQVFVLADSAYDSLSIDEVAASHVKADCVVRDVDRTQGYFGMSIGRTWFPHEELYGWCSDSLWFSIYDTCDPYTLFFRVSN